MAYTVFEVVAAAFILREDKLFVARRSLQKRIAPGMLHLPGGHIDSGETPVAALKREFLEEFGLVIEVGKPFHTYTYSTETGHAVGITFFARLISALEEMNIDRSETEEVMWFTESEIKSRLSEADHDFQAVQAGFRMLSTVTGGHGNQQGTG